VLGRFFYLQIIQGKDLKELREEGIDAQLIPWVEDKNN